MRSINISNTKLNCLVKAMIHNRIPSKCFITSQSVILQEKLNHHLDLDLDPILLTCTRQCLVHRALVNPRLWWLAVGLWDEPHGRHIGVELLGAGLGELVGGVVPAGALQVQTRDVTAVIRVLLQLRRRFPHNLGTQQRKDIAQITY